MEHDPALVIAVMDELREKLTLEIYEFLGAIRIKLTRSGQLVNVWFNNNQMEINMTLMPDNTYVEAEKYDLFDPGFDPVKQICRFADKALKIESVYKNKTIISKKILEYLL